jgi:hypothetical protein
MKPASILPDLKSAVAAATCAFFLALSSQAHAFGLDPFNTSFRKQQR